MGNVDYRVFPLSHQDLHVLSWLTPCIKAWSAVSGLELIATILLQTHRLSSQQQWFLTLLLTEQILLAQTGSSPTATLSRDLQHQVLRSIMAIKEDSNISMDGHPKFVATKAATECTSAA